MTKERPKGPCTPRQGDVDDRTTATDVAHPDPPLPTQRTLRKILRVGSSDAVTIPIKWTARWVNPAARILVTVDNLDGTITVSALTPAGPTPPPYQEPVE